MESLRKHKQVISSSLLLTVLLQIVSPVVVFANTDSESQVEYSNAGGGGSEMVNMYNGALNYSLPLMSIPGQNIGYNLTLSYNSDEVKMLNTASFVGFGWNLNLGSITRNVQAVPDDFKGDEIVYKNHIKPYKSVDISLGELSSSEYGGFPISLSMPKGPGCSSGNVDPKKIFNESYTGHLYWDNYTGMGVRIGVNENANLNMLADYMKVNGGTKPASASIGLEIDTKRGVGYNLSGSYSFINASVSGYFNQGLNSISLGYSGIGPSASVGLLVNTMVSSPQMAMRTKIYNGHLKFGMNMVPITEGTKDANGVIDPSTSPNADPDFKTYMRTGGFRLEGFNHSNSGLLGSMKVSYVNSTVRQEVFSTPAYGYLYKAFDNRSEYVKDYTKYSFDYKKGTNFLPTGQIGNDIFIQNDQGSGGVFTARTKNFDVWSATGVTSVTKQREIGGEFSLTNLFQINDDPSTCVSEFEAAVNPSSFHAGVNFLTGNGTSYGGGFSDQSINNSKLKSINAENGRIPFVKNSEIQIEKEGEKSLIGLGDDEPRRMQVKRQGDFFTGSQRFNVMPGNENEDKQNGWDVFWNGGSGTYNSSNSYVNSRIADFKQHSYVQYLTTDEALVYGRSKNFGYLKSISNSAAYRSDVTNSELQNNRSHHIAEINVYETNGLVYTYSEPIYNLHRVDAMFSLEYEQGGDFEGVEVNQYEKSLPLKNKNANGVTFGKAKPLKIDNSLHTGMEMLNVSMLPEYAATWPVAMISSADYVDSDGIPGPSNNDLGGWMKFTYNEKIQDYQWRTPYENVQVTDGVKGESGDDMGFYRYGVKEVKYVSSIESKTHIAIFHYSDRIDAHEVKSELEGGLGNTVLKKLDRIELYLKRNDLNDGSKTLVQTVNFVYDYSLVPGEPSNSASNLNNKGKLTLLEVYTTFYDSKKGESYKYKFNYGFDSNNPTADDYKFNPKYNRGNLDRWGNFKRNYDESGNPINDNYPAQDFSYTEDEALARTAPWCLRNVELPTGASMSFDFEPRDYAYVEDKPALKMYDIVTLHNLKFITPSDLDKKAERGVDKDPNKTLTDSYSEEALNDLGISRNHVAIVLPADRFQNLSANDQKDKFYREYIQGIEKELYLKVYAFLEEELQHTLFDEKEKNYDYVELMSKLDDDGALGDLPYSVHQINGVYYGLINLDPVFPQVDAASIARQGAMAVACNGQISAIRAAIFEHIKTKRSEIFYGKLGDKSSINPLQALKLLNTAMTGMTCSLIGNGYGNYVRLNGWSKIRLKDPDGFKYGGGYRVSSITLFDNWTEDSPQKPYSYKQTYDYTIEEGSESEKRIISSGVAIEPLTNREENANYKLYYYQEEIPLAENNTRYNAGHPLDVFNTGVSVGYRKVTVRNEYPIGIENQIKKSIAPHTVYEFHTPKDYPVIQKFTQTSAQDNEMNYMFSVPVAGGATIRDNMVSQGYTVVKNDMSGKLKSITQLTRENNVISSQTYKYFSDKRAVNEWSYSNNFKKMELGGAKVVDHLQNDNIPSLNSGRLNSADMMKMENIRIGEDYDVWLDVNESSENMKDQSWVQLNVGVNPAPSLLYIVPIFGLPINTNSSSDKQVVLNKVINRRGILQEVITQKDQSEIRTQYLAYDQETAAPLLTKVDNEWHATSAQKEAGAKSAQEPMIYKFTRPAYWEYNYNGVLGSSKVETPFMGAYKTIDHTLSIIASDQDGNLNLNPAYFTDGDKVAYSKGLNNTVYIGYILRDESTLKYKLFNELSDFSAPEKGPIANIRVLQSGNTNLVNTTVGELVFKTYTLNAGILVPSDYLNASAITFGGTWDKDCCGNYLGRYLNNPFINGSRNKWLPYQSFVFHNERLYNTSSYSQRGLIKDFTPFNWQTASATNWVLSSTAVKYDLWNNLIQQKDALGLYSSSLYGFGKAAVTGVASNASRKEFGLENFEEKGYLNCFDNGNIGISSSLSFLNYNSVDGTITNERSHTGKYSLKVNQSQIIKVSNKISCGTSN